MIKKTPIHEVHPDAYGESADGRHHVAEGVTRADVAVAVREAITATTRKRDLAAKAAKLAEAIKDTPELPSANDIDGQHKYAVGVWALASLDHASPFWR